MKINIKYQDAVEILGDEKKFSKKDRIVKDEWSAITTHWLQNREEKPIYLDSKVKDRWLEVLVKMGNDTVVDQGTDQLKLSLDTVPFPGPAKPLFNFIDLFAGIGGFRIALQELGGRCVFSSEWDKAAKETYFNNFGEVPFGDIRQFTGKQISDNELDKLIPNHDILTAGFPCQPFSRAGVSARTSLGKLHGFDDPNQGNLFFDIVRIAKVKKPKVLFLENVKNLQSHDNGNTFQVIKETIENYLGYEFKYKIVNANTEVPQNRERCYMVAFKPGHNFQFPEFKGEVLPLKSILEKDVSEKYTISDKLWEGHIRRSSRNVARGTGFTAYEANLDKPSNTIVARYYKDGKECLIPQKGGNPRMLTPRECARLQGFPENYILSPSKSAAYRQFGNSLAVPVVRKIAKNIVKEMLYDNKR